MKLLIFVISLFILAAQSQTSDLDLKGCAVELGINDDEAKTLKPDDPRLKCIIDCAFKKKGLIKDGKIVFDVALNMSKKEEIGSVDDIKDKINDCIEKTSKETSECELSFAFLDCMAESPPKKGK